VLFTDESVNLSGGIRGCVLSVSGTVVTANTVSGPTAVLVTPWITGGAVPIGLSLSSTLYVVAFQDIDQASASAIAFSVSGTATTAGTKVILGTTSAGTNSISQLAGNGAPSSFNRLLFALSATQALLLHFNSTLTAVSFSVSGTTITVGSSRAISRATSSSLCHTSIDGASFVVSMYNSSSGTISQAVASYTVAGGVASFSGVHCRPGFVATSAEISRNRFSNGNVVFRQLTSPDSGGGVFFALYNAVSGAPPTFLGDIVLPVLAEPTTPPIEIASTRFTIAGIAINISGPTKKLLIVEMAQ
jgi:hypothetical protein